jgi:hypothetical protein
MRNLFTGRKRQRAAYDRQMFERTARAIEVP